MRNYFIYSAVLIISLFTACTDDGLCIRGDGELREYELDVADFDEIVLTGPVDLTIIQGETSSVKVLAESQLMEVMEYEVRGGELSIGFKGKFRCLNTNKGVRVIATVAELEKVSIDGDSHIDNEGALHLDDFTIDCDGVGDVRLTGTVRRQYLLVNGKIDVDNFELLSSETFIEVNGKGDFDLSCADQLTIEVNGKAEVNYIGSPQISKDVNGLLNLNKVHN
ncbi:hypothetical protein GCM10007049_22650 [Echinicola pacifica]|uniref:Putative auto-transporter adhesin head GIN domain-containing protein n=1 Tax=Echinicola pacifica TaxID=346377 RepID=A0A918URU2_9BACT|nr:DUF2807 domain-containing protein [Echinicola pacifica]GGZ29013.1 hypothetical protein GCM10007049_22650 [Echinicola pacifica]